MPETIKQWTIDKISAVYFQAKMTQTKPFRPFAIWCVGTDIHQVISVNDTVREGKILITVHNVKDPAPVIDIFNANKAEYNPDGSRNLREDVAGLTLGAMLVQPLEASLGHLLPVRWEPESELLPGLLWERGGCCGWRVSGT